MSYSKVFLASSAMLLATFFLGAPTPASADPTGTTFDWTSLNLQGDSAGEAVPFGVPTLTTSGVTISTMATSAHPPVPAAGWVGGVGGGELIQIWIDTHTPNGNNAFLSGDPNATFDFDISGINWGPGAPAALVSGFVMISFDIDGAPVDLDEGNLVGAVIAPNPAMPGFEAIVLTNTAGNPADSFGFGSPDVLGLPLAGVIDALSTLPDIPTVLSVNSIHFAFEIVHVPEPASFLLLGTGLASLLLMRRQRNQ